MSMFHNQTLNYLFLLLRVVFIVYKTEQLVVSYLISERDDTEERG